MVELNICENSTAFAQPSNVSRDTGKLLLSASFQNLRSKGRGTNEEERELRRKRQGGQRASEVHSEGIAIAFKDFERELRIAHSYTKPISTSCSTNLCNSAEIKGGWTRKGDARSCSRQTSLRGHALLLRLLLLLRTKHGASGVANARRSCTLTRRNGFV